MKRSNPFKLLLSAFAFILISALYSSAQETPAAAINEGPKRARPNLFRELGLTPDQLQQIRQINIERRPLNEAAHKRMAETKTALDTAIYAESVNDGDVRLRLQEFQSAQAEVSKIKFMNELSVRKILNPEQLVKFKELRGRFEAGRRNLEWRRRNQQERRRMRREQPVEKIPND